MNTTAKNNPCSEHAFLTVNQASELFQVHRATILRWIAEGQLPAHKIGGAYRLPADGINAALDATATAKHPHSGVI